MFSVKLLLLGALAAATASPVPFNRNKTPVSDSDFILLLEKGYSFAENGSITAPKSQVPLANEEYYYLIEDLRSGARLKALMEINLILNRNDYSTNLPAGDRKSLREVGFRNWNLLSKQTREQIAPHFTAKELFELNEKLAEVSAQPPALVDGGHVVSAATLPMGVRIPLDSPLKTAAGPLLPLSRASIASVITSAPPKEAKPLAAPSANAEPLPLPTELELKYEAETLPAPSPAPPPETVEPTAPSLAPPQPTFRVEMPVPPASPTARAGNELNLGVLAPSPALPQPPAALPVRVHEPAPEPIPPLPPAPAPKPIAKTPPASPVFNEADSQAFLENAPYAPAVKSLLGLILKHAEKKDQSIALASLMTAEPALSIDRNRAGTEGLYALTPSNAQGRIDIALQPGAIEVERRRIMRGRRVYLLPRNDAFYQGLGVPMPAGEDFILRERSEGQLAGALLHALTKIHHLNGGASPLDSRVETAAASAEFRLYKNIKKFSGGDPVLDASRFALYQEWSARPEDFHDFLAQVLLDRTGDAGGILREAGAADSAPRASQPVRPPDPETRFTPYAPANGNFRVEKPSLWTAWEEETGRSSATHILGPEESGGTFRAAFHVHFFEKGKPGFQEARDFIKSLRAGERDATALRSWRVGRGPGRIFEVRESRLLPHGKLPAGEVNLHHYYAFVANGATGYVLIKLSTTEETFLSYREEFYRFLKSFRIAGY